MKYLLALLTALLSISIGTAQFGSTTTERVLMPWEKPKTEADYFALANYSGDKVAVAINTITIPDHVLKIKPQLGDRGVGLGFAEITMAVLQYSNRFSFVETNDEMKNRMFKQHQASAKGLTTDKVNLRGNIKPARFFVDVKITEYSEGQDEVITKDGVTTQLTVRLGLQITLSEQIGYNGSTGLGIISGTGVGDIVTTRQMDFFNSANTQQVPFNDSAIGSATKTALFSGGVYVIEELIKQGVFDH